MIDRLLLEKLYVFGTSALGRTIRVLFLSLLIYRFFSLLGQPFGAFRLPVILFNCLLIFEVFMRFKIGNKKNGIPLSSPKRTHMYDSFSSILIDAYARSQSFQHFMHVLLKTKLTKFVLKKADIASTELQIVTIDFENLFKKSDEIAHIRNGRLITTGDVIAAYLILTEEQTKLLFKKELHEPEMIEIAAWAVIQLHAEEGIDPTEIHFNGTGIFDGLIYGWTPETKKYTKEVSWNTKEMNAQLIGRKKDFMEIQKGLLKQENNNILLVGPVGSGKEYLVRYLAVLSYRGILQKQLNHKRLLELLVGTLIAGANERGAVEARLNAIIEEISHAGNVLLYIPNIDQMLGASGFQLDTSGALLPYLKTQQLPVIASVTPGAYKEFIADNPIHEVFTPIILEDPSESTMLEILFSRTPLIEKGTRVNITFSAVRAALENAETYLPDDHLPGSAVQLLTDAIVEKSHINKAVSLTKDDIIEKISQKTNILLGKPTKEESETLLTLKDLLHKKVIGQDAAITAVSTALKRIRATQTKRTKPISFLFLGPTGVGKTQTVKTLADVYFKGEKNILRFDMSEFSGIDGVQKLIGSAGDRQEGSLTDKVHDAPYSLILLDEFEKANDQVHNLFLQVLDDARLTDGNGKTVSFVNTFIIATSNAGSEYIREHITEDMSDFKKSLLDYLQTNGIFRPELLNRFDDVIIFTPLSQVVASQIIQLLLEELSKKYKEQDITITFTPEVVTKILQEGLNVEFGARPLKRYITDTIEGTLADFILKEQMGRGTKVSVLVDQNNSFTFSVQ